ncbi:TPA: RNA-binding S4 domain-containing protein [Candidatus Woesearchaeota archaeon]|nr:RNA-binding S4 domain-containing protein [Candidatus Woesearchaeota archaeon]
MQDTIGEYIELNAFLKSKGIAQTGGQIKLIIRAGNVKVNGEVDLRNKRKLRDKDVVEYIGKKYVVGLNNLKK